jgi:hypothetical protein
MKITNIAACAVVCLVVCLICCDFGVAQNIANARADFRAGIHSGSWTLKREQLLEEESKDLYRSCPDPYCARCAKHLADYGHEYQYVGGPSQRQLFYRGTAGNVAIVTQRGYDQRGLPYRHRGNPSSAIVSWEYQQTLNHAIMEQVNARNAVAAEEAAQDRVILLTQLFADAKEQLRLTEEAWKQIEPMGKPCLDVVVGTVIVDAVVVGTKAGSPCSKTYEQFYIDMRAGRYEVARQELCFYCLAQARYLFDLAYVADVGNELALAQCFHAQRSAAATEAVRIALLSKEDADKATRFKRLQYKPPKYREVLAARGVPEPEPPTEKVNETEE